MKTLLSVLISTFLSISISAQTVSGKLIDENSQPLPYANVVLLSLPDSTFVTGTISGEDGRRRRIFHLGGYIRKPDSKNIFYRIYDSVQTSISGQYRYSSARV